MLLITINTQKEKCSTYFRVNSLIVKPKAKVKAPIKSTLTSNDLKSSSQGEISDFFGWSRQLSTCLQLRYFCKDFTCFCHVSVNFLLLWLNIVFVQFGSTQKIRAYSV